MHETATQQIEEVFGGEAFPSLAATATVAPLKASSAGAFLGSAMPLVVFSGRGEAHQQ